MADLETVYNHIFALEYTQGFQSYDIYDGSGLNIPGLRRFRSTRMVSTYFNKFSPVNFRKFLGISRRKYPHAVACMVNAYYNASVERVPAAFIREQVDWLLSASLIEKYGYHCWNGIGISIDMKQNTIDPGVPGLIGTSAVARALAAYYKKTGDAGMPEVLRSVRDDIIQNYYQVYSGVSFFRYKPNTSPWQFTINASAKGAALVFHINHLLGENKGLDLAESAVSSIINAQEADGRWKYTIDLKDGRHKEQADFHQAYIIKSLLDIYETGLLEISVTNTVKEALVYQNTVQLQPSGALYYRHPRKYPYNIHNQLYAYFVNRMAGFLGVSNDWEKEADRIFKWTMKHLYSPEIGFIYGAYPGIKIKIPYLRWGNAHALYLFSILMNKLTGGESEDSNTIEHAHVCTN
ncbi:MAG: hypothetical protein ACOC1Q_01830 [Desulfosalsimonas sp.]